MPTPTIGPALPKVLPLLVLLAPGPFVPLGFAPRPPLEGVEPLFENPKPLLPLDPIPLLEPLPKPLDPVAVPLFPLFEKPKLELPLLLVPLPFDPFAAPFDVPFAGPFVPELSGIAPGA